MRVWFVLAIVLLLSVPPISAQALLGYVYADASFTGTAGAVYSNTALTSLSGWGPGNDKITSINFAGVEGYFVDFCLNSNYGSCFTVRTPFSIPSLSPNGWNDQISSIRAYPVPFGVPGVMLYENQYMAGKFRYYGGNAMSGYNYISLSPFPNNAISSMIVYENSQVWVFSGTGGSNSCPDLSCASYSSACTPNVPYGICSSTLRSTLSPDNVGQSLYIGFVYPPGYTTSTTNAVTTASASTTNAVTTSTSTVAASTTFSTANAVSTATVSWALAGVRAALTTAAAGGAKRDFSGPEKGSTGGSRPAPVEENK